jgi:MFS family permease
VSPIDASNSGIALTGDSSDRDSSHVESGVRTPMKRVAAASFVGSAIEYYDFFLYGTAAALVFPTVFFPDLSQPMATVASMASFAVAFLARPVGAAVFGYFGDRLGRKTTLVATLMIMGLSTLAVGFVPSTATIGVAAPLILLALRLLQGFAVGGEWAGAALLSAEHAPAAKRGMYGMFTQIGVGAGLVLTNLIFLVIHLSVAESSHAFMRWGWRIPFLLSAVLIVIALYVRLNVGETPVFAEEHARKAIPKAPLADLFKTQRRQIFIAAGAIVGGPTFGYIVGTYLPSYAHTTVAHSRTLILSTGVLGGLALIASVAAAAYLCDIYGRRRLILVGFALSLPWSFVVVPLVDTGHSVVYAATMVTSTVIQGVAFGPLAAFIPEIFATRYRYSGTGLAFNIAAVIGGAIPPVIAGLLMTAFGSWAVGALVAPFIVVSLVCTYLLPETKGITLAP